jgi:hypothetical protein
MNEMPYGLRVVKGYIPWVGRSRGKELEEIQDNCRREPMGCVILSCEGTLI